MSFRRLVQASILLAVFTMAARVSVDTDTWWHLRAGAWMVEYGSVLRVDEFSLTRFGQPWVYPGWLAQVLLFRVYQIGSFAGLNLLTALIVAIAFAVMWSALDGPVLMRAIVLLLAATTSAVYWAARPHILSFALTAVFILVLEKARQGKRGPLWVLPLLMALWSNLHGGFAIGFILMGIYLVGEGLDLVTPVLTDAQELREVWGSRGGHFRFLAGTIVFSLLALGLNPHGWQMLSYPLKTVSIDVLRDYIQEWQSPDFHRLETQPFLWMFFLMVTSLAFSRVRAKGHEVLLVVVFGYLSFTASRNIASFALAVSPALARHGFSAVEPFILRVKSGDRQLPGRTASILNVVLLILFVLLAILKITLPLSERVNAQAIKEQVPVAAVSHIRQNRYEGNLFNSYNWGGYVLWELYPDYPSFVDGRTDLFDDEILGQYLQAWRADQGWEEILQSWDIRIALLEVDSPLARALGRAGWSEVYADEQAVVLNLPNSP